MLDCQKPLFTLPSGLHYLNCAYMGPLLREVEDAGIEGIRRRRDPTSIAPADFFSGAAEVRECFARVIGAPEPERVAILPAVSYGMAIVARNLPVARGQNVVVVEAQFPSNVYPWRRLADARGAEVRTVPAPPMQAGRGAAWNEAILAAIDEATAAVAIGHVHWADGTRFDLEAIGARARGVGAALVIDGTQSVGALPFDVARVRPDALICAAYKWLLGPYGLALGYFGRRFDGGEPLEENWINRRGSENFSRLVHYEDEYQPGALRYDVGERSNPVLLPMAAAALRRILAWGPERVQEYCQTLAEPAIERIRGAGYEVEAAEWRGAHLFGVRLPAGTGIERVRDALARRSVAVSVRGTALRVSPNVYNDAADMAALVDALAEAAA